jgi:hypothetical protein
MDAKTIFVQEVKVVDYHTTKEKATEDGYVSSLICKRGDDEETFKVSFKAVDPPEKDSKLKIRFSSLSKKGLPKFAVIVKDEEDVNNSSMTKTFTEWITLGGYPLENGEMVSVKNDANDNVYTVKRAKTGSSVHCSCPAWKFQKIYPQCRTCKHCTAVLGKEEDMRRLISSINDMADKLTDVKLTT